MAIQVVETLTPGSIKTLGSNVSFSLAAGSGQQANDVLIIWVFWDNFDATTPEVGFMTPPSGETAVWNRAVHIDSQSATGNAGVIAEMWTIRTTMVWPRTTYFVPQFNNPTTAKGVVGVVARGLSQWPTQVVTGTTSAAAPANANDLVIGVASYQANTAGVGESDTTGGAWNTGTSIFTSGQSSSTNVAGRMQWKIPSSTGSQTYNTSTASYSTAAVVFQPLVPPSTPTGFTASQDQIEQVETSWNQTADQLSFEVLRNGVVVATAANGLPYTTTVPYPGSGIATLDNWTVRAKGEGGLTGAESAVAVGRALPAKLRNFGGFTVTETSNRLSWSRHAYDMTVRIYRDGVLVHTDATTGGSGSVTWDDTGLVTGQAYSYTATTQVGTYTTTAVGPISITPEAVVFLLPTADHTASGSVTIIGGGSNWYGTMNDGIWGASGPSAFDTCVQLTFNGYVEVRFDYNQIPAGKWIKSGAVVGYCVDGVDYAYPGSTRADRVEVANAGRLPVNPPREYESVSICTEEGNALWITAPIVDAVAKDFGARSDISYFTTRVMSTSGALKVGQLMVMAPYEDAIVAAPTGVSVVSAVGDEITLAFTPVPSPSVIGYTALIGNVYSRVDQLTSPITFTGSTKGATGVSVQLFAHSSTGRLGPGSTVIPGVVATPHPPRDCCVVTDGDGTTQISVSCTLSWNEPIRQHETWSLGTPIYTTNVYRDGALLTGSPLAANIRRYKDPGAVTIGQEYTYTVRHVCNGLEGEPATIKHTPLRFATFRGNSEVYRSPRLGNNTPVSPDGSTWYNSADPWTSSTNTIDHSLASAWQ